MTRKEIESLVRETLREEFGHGPRAAIEFHGSQSVKCTTTSFPQNEPRL